MAYQLSPGVTWSEIDLTTVVPSLSTTEGGFAGDFDWGPINHVMTVSNEIELVRWFHKPSSNTFTSWFTAANFLAYAESLKVIRAANTTVAKNATNGSAGLLIENQDDYELNFMNMQAANTSGMFAARYAGDLGNSIKVSIFAGGANASSDYASWEYATDFNGVPSTSSFVSDKGGANDEMHIIVVDRYGKFSGGQANTVLEKYAFASKASDAKNDDGSSNYYVNVINEKSDFVYIINHAQNPTSYLSETTTWGSVSVNTSFQQTNASYTSVMAGGVVGSPTDGDLISAFDTFASVDEYDISLVMTGAANTTVQTAVLSNIGEGRRDCVVFVSPSMAEAVDNAGDEAVDMVTHRNNINLSTSYGFMDSAWKKQFDKYNNVYRWVPLNGDIAGLCARTDFTRDPWFSPAGMNRGGIKNVTKLSWNPSVADRDTLYKNGINPVVTFKGEGTVLYGDKMLLAKPSAFDRINVRRLFITLEKSISRAAKYSLFEFNDEFTRAQFVALVEPFLRDVKGRRGIYDFKVVCDETNNTGEVIDRNEFVGDIYIKPARVINFIQLNFVATRTGIAFSEIVGQF